MSNEYFATIQYRQHEQELVRDLERRRILAERRYQQFSHPKFRRSFQVTVRDVISRFRGSRSHQPVRS